MLHKEILSQAQERLLPLVRGVGQGFALCGGTSIALHIGHRASIDFDLFTSEELNINTLRRKLSEADKNFAVLVKSEDEYTVAVKGVKITFLRYPFPFEGSMWLDDVIQVPDLLSLAAMKAYALGRRSKWKDYVDLYFILSKYHSLREVADRAAQMFGNEFNEKIFRAALAYFDDIDYSEAVIFQSGFEVSDEAVRAALKDVSTGE